MCRIRYARSRSVSRGRARVYPVTELHSQITDFLSSCWSSPCCHFTAGQAARVSGGVKGCIHALHALQREHTAETLTDTAGC
ncbi:hypothetical protein CesoFtcFv8_008246 [Champsocephalus esox]|uniref:Uncharacterized protein n=2 Tax=Champsocephalus TaxID=52236 RepID=A0AAN8DM96_CHAGU|nr:hypothetical protein CesoFtcFv8_008246 [Champsocephalus esox]KAK5925812.1 hypothetical protein CgunFtcFv8_021439 [Champsocephalus gunnari]